MWTLKQIATHYAVSVNRARLAVKKAGIKPVGQTGRTLLYSPDDLRLIANALANTQTRTRKKKNAESSASTSTVPAGTEPEQGSQATLPSIDPMAGDPQALPESPSNM